MVLPFNNFHKSADYTLPNSKTTATIVPHNKRIRESNQGRSKMWNNLFLVRNYSNYQSKKETKEIRKTSVKSRVYSIY